MNACLYLPDTFSYQHLKGNPTPVCLLRHSLAVETMHAMAIQFNAPVTAFVEPVKANHIFPIRYFTVTGEIPACGHATLGAAFALFSEGHTGPLVFETTAHTRLTATKENDLVWIQYPALAASTYHASPPMLEALGIEPHEISNQFFCEALQSAFIELPDETAVTRLQPCFDLLLNSDPNIKEVVVMSRSQLQAFDYTLRSFCPWIGIDEDPVTGSVHAVLGHYWQQKPGKKRLRVWQASERGGLLLVEALPGRVSIGGYCGVSC